MISVVLAVDVEFESSAAAALSAAGDIAVRSRPADGVELAAAMSAGAAEVYVLSRYFPGVDAEFRDRARRLGVRILGYGAGLVADWGVAVEVEAGCSAEALCEAVRACAQAEPAEVSEAPAVAPVEAGSPGRIVAVWGADGAPGRSTIAAALADISSRAERTVLVDADTVHAGQAVMLGLLDDASKIAALCRSAESLDDTVISRCIARVRDGLDVVTGLSRADRWPEVRAGALTAVLEELAKRYPVVIVDVSARVDPDDPLADPFYDRHAATRAALDAADEVIVVGAAEPPALVRLMNVLSSERFRHAEKTHVVVNRVREGAVGADPEQRIQQTLQRFVACESPVLLPDARDALDRAVLAGTTIIESAPKNPLSIALWDFARQLGLAPAGRRRAGRPRRRGFAKLLKSSPRDSGARTGRRAGIGQ